MDFAFIPADASVGNAVRRIAGERIDDALAALSGAQRGDDAVHTVRKRMKQLRALVRLVGDGLPHPKREEREFRAIARALSGARDAAVMADTFDRLAKSAPRPIDVDAAYAVRIGLAAARSAAADNAAGEVDAISRLAEARQRVAAWPLDGGGWSTFGAGLVSTYAEARKMMREALKSGDDEAVHAWRKVAKAHFYHLELLRPIWPQALKAQIKAADRLQEGLGEHHDASLLAAHLEKHAADYGGERAVTPILALLHARQVELEDEAHALGARLFAEHPDAFATRIRSYWKEWRRELRQAAAARLAA